VSLLTSSPTAAVQKQLGVDQPDFGVLFDEMEYLDGSEVPSARLIQAKVEAEVAFVLGRDLPVAAPTYGEFVACVAFCLPALEIVDGAIADWKITLVDAVADIASCGLYVLGDQPIVLGQALKAGELILSGALGPMVSIAAGDEIRANLGALGSVACRMV